MKKILVEFQLIDKKASVSKTTASMSNLGKATQKTNKGFKDNTASAGLNNAILMETSRLASDASYGFIGIGNNLSQLVNLFQMSAKSAGGMLASFKKLFTFNAVLIVGLQLLLSFMPKIIKRFKSSTKEIDGFSGAFDEFAKSVGSSAGNFEIYVRTLQDSNKSEKEKGDAIKMLNKEFPDYIKSLNDSGLSLNDVKNNTNAAKIATDNFRDSILALAVSQAAQKKIQDLQAEVLEKQLARELQLKELNLTEDELAAEAGIKRTRRQAILEDTTRANTVRRLAKETEEHNLFIEQKNKEIEILLEKVDIEVKGEKKLTDSKKREKAKRLQTDIEAKGTTIQLEKEQNKAVREALEEGFGTTFKQQQAHAKKELDLFGKKFKAERALEEQKKRDHQDSIERRHQNEMMFFDATSELLYQSSQLAGEHTQAGKLLAVASATMDTYAAANAFLAAKPATPLNFVQAAAAIATGLVNVKKILSVKVPGTSGGGAVAGAGGDTVAPDFNVVGQSQTSQLARVIGEGRETPLRAYVVGKDIRTQDELDRNITQTAGL